MNSKERMKKALAFEPPDRPPHFELMFEVEKEAFGLAFPDRTLWADCTKAQKEAMVETCMEVYAKILDTYKWDALSVYWPWSDPDGVRAAKRHFGDRVWIGGFVGAGLWSIDTVKDWMQFSIDLMDRPDFVHETARQRCDAAIEKIDMLVDAGADFIITPNDVAFNAGPFISPEQYSEFVTPYWSEQVARIKDRGAYAFIHTDGNVMPILDDLLGMGADCFQSVDPMAGMDIAALKKICHGKLALMGNVQCNLLQDGPDEEIRKSARYCLENASQGGGYIYGSSNTIFPGMPLKNYEYMLRVYWEFVKENEKNG